MLAILAAAACGDDGASPDAAIDSDATATDAPVSTSDASQQVDYAESFDQDGPAWPAPWVVSGGVAIADVVGGRARLVPVVTNYSLARVVLAGDAIDADVTFSVEFDDLVTQGLGFYVRQNGGYLQQTDPRGQGYAVFIEGFRGSPGIGVWHEIDGEERQIQVASDPIPNMRSGVVYRVRFIVTQQGATETRLQCKIWEASDQEPDEWAIDRTDDTGVLQGLAGGFAVDAWSSITPNTPGNPTPAALFFDDLEIRLAP